MRVLSAASRSFGWPTMVGVWLALVGMGACGRGGDVVVPAAAPVVAGLAGPGLDARSRGLVLLAELGCVACHAPSGTELAAPAVPHGPDLVNVGHRVRPQHLARFLADSRYAEPGTTMPDLLGEFDAAGRSAAARQLSQYLRSFAPSAAEPVAEPADAKAAARGKDLFDAIGCSMCHAPRDDRGAELPVIASVPMAPLPAKYTVPALRAFLLAPLAARPSGRMPDLGLTPGEAGDLAHFLLAAPAGDASADAPADAPAGPSLTADTDVAAGRTLFAERGCAHCHSLPDAARPASRAQKPLRELDAARGCLSAAKGPWPGYSLSPQQRSDVASALAALADPLDDGLRIQQQLAARNCIACHVRDDIGGVSQDRNRLCTSNDPSIGQESRLPPPLTGVGAKLQRSWLHDAIAHGQRERPYLNLRMPAFGAAFAAGLTELLARTDSLQPFDVTPLPEDDKARRAVIDLGRTLVGDKGMNCIACHTFAGERSGSLGAMDLVASTERRLQPQWFGHFLRTPLRFNPNTLMPQFFPDGKTTRPELGDGSTQGQIEAIWHYLAEGRNVGQPSGMRRPPIELTVGDEAVLLRRSVQQTGKRGISVGLPRGVNLTFDAERLALNQIWWGAFLDAAGVWTSQGHGQARILGKERIALPTDAAVAQLAAPDAPWPGAARRELAYRWLGYDLDAQQRPTFRYTCGEVTIEDGVREVAAETAADGAAEAARPSLRRTLRCSGPGNSTLTFLLARDTRVERVGDDLVQVGGMLRLRLPAGTFRIHAGADASELRVDIQRPAGRGELTMDYQFVEGGK